MIEQPPGTTRIGVIGTGNIARQIHLPVLTSMPGIRVAWVADANPASAQAVARAFDLSARPLPLDAGHDPDCDAVLIASPVGTRRPYLEYAAARGLAAFVEKPFARSVAEHRAFASLFPPGRVGCGFMRRTYDASLILGRILDEGWLGRPTRIVIREGGRGAGSGTDASYFDSAGLGGGILLELGCHAIDLVLQLTHTTRWDVIRRMFRFDGSPDRTAEGEVRLLPEGAGPIALDYRFSWVDDLPCTTEFHFPSARLTVGNKPDSPVRLAGRGAAEFPLQPTGRGAVSWNQAFALEWRDFLDGLGEARGSSFDAASALPVTALIEELYDGARGA